MNSVIEKISNAGIIPVVKIDDAANAKALAGALVRGGRRRYRAYHKTG